jgi:hypothetical protein
MRALPTSLLTASTSGWQPSMYEKKPVTGTFCETAWAKTRRVVSAGGTLSVSVRRQ